MRFRPLLIPALAALVLAGCGKSDSAAPGGPSGGEPVAAVAEEFEDESEQEFE